MQPTEWRDSCTVRATWQVRVESRAAQSTVAIHSLYSRAPTITDGRADIPEHIWRALFRGGQGDVIRLDHIPAGSLTRAVGLDVARQHRSRVVLEDSFLPPGAPWDCASPTESDR